MLKREIETSTFNKKELFEVNKSSPTNSANSNNKTQDEYSLSAVPFDPTNSSPQDKFINTIKIRMDRYYSLSN